MAEALSPSWRRRGAFDGVLRTGRHGGTGGEPGISVAARENLGLATIVAREARAEPLGHRLRELFGIVPPGSPKIAVGRTAALVWSGPGQWLLASEERDIAQRLSTALAGLAAVSDQSDARAILRVGGPRARETLAKGCPIDLHPRAFAPGDVALTSIAHIGAQLWQVDDGPTYDVAVFRSMAGSFWSWFAASAAEHGCEVSTSGDVR